MTNEDRNISRFLKFFVPVAVLAIVAAAAVFIIETRHAHRSIESQEGQLVTLAAALIRNDLATPRKDLLSLSQLKSLAHLMNGDVSAAADVNADFDAFVKEHPHYDQLRILDANGREIVRINRTPTGALAVPTQRLQAKGDRYYFRDGFRESRGQVYVSPLDLNIEHGQIERPFKPTIRFATPLFDDHGVKRGVIVLNFLAGPLLEQLRQLGRSSHGGIWLLNRNGYALLAPRAADEFGFMFPNRGTKVLSALDPALWSWLSTHRTASGMVAGALVTRERLCGDTIECRQSTSAAAPMLTLPFTAGDQPWSILTLVGPRQLDASSLVGRQFLSIYVLFAILALIAALSGRTAWKLAGTLRALREREQELRRTMALVEPFIDNSPIPMFIKSPATGRYLYANRSFAELYDRTPQAVVGATDVDLTSDPHVAAVRRAQDTEVAEGARPREYISEVPSKTGTRHLAWLKFSMRDDEGEIYAVGGIARDITERVVAERALERTAAFFAALYEAAPDAILTVRSDGMIAMANSRAAKIFGYTIDELILRRYPKRAHLCLAKVVHPSDVPGKSQEVSVVRVGAELV
ncbi:MAG: PAS domain-containing protein, partial [Steroidobacteraceae bacterium]